jgi:hypothetical protein
MTYYARRSPTKRPGKRGRRRIARRRISAKHLSCLPCAQTAAPEGLFLTNGFVPELLIELT